MERQRQLTQRFVAEPVRGEAASLVLRDCLAAYLPKCTPQHE
jgi:hypothetical protein